MNLKALMAAVLMAMTPMASKAVTSISAGETDFDMAVLNGTPTAIFEYVADGPLLVTGAASGTSAPSASALEKISFQLVLKDDFDALETDGDPTTSGFDLAVHSFMSPQDVGMMGIPAFADTGGLGGLTLEDGEEFLVIFSSALPGGFSVPVTYSINTAVIPLPAAGWMLLSAVAGAGFLSRRRRAA